MYLLTYLLTHSLTFGDLLQQELHGCRSAGVEKSTVLIATGATGVTSVGVRGNTRPNIYFFVADFRKNT